jgi:hypothetical protein
MDLNSVLTETQEDLQRLIGQTLLKSRNFCGTRHFYFGESSLKPDTDRPCYTLGLECPWRIQTRERIVVGSEDYDPPPEGKANPTAEPATMSILLQDQRLAELLGELRDGDVTNTGHELTVDSVEADRYGGFQVGMTGGYSLAVFPCSREQMEWILILPGGGSLMLINGVPTKSSRHPAKSGVPNSGGR